MTAFLDQVEAGSQVWKKIKDHLEHELDTLRRKNDDPEMSAEKTALIRGRIKQIKILLALDQAPPGPAPTQAAGDD
jgi:hypothetical protein